MKDKLKQNKGFTGVEVAVALVILMIFVSLISTLFINIYLSYTGNKRNAEATAYATQIMETAQKMYYADVTKENLDKKVKEMNIPNGYKISLQVNNYKNGENETEDLVKTVKVTVTYSVGQEWQKVEFEAVKEKEILITPNKPILAENMVPVKYVINKDSNTTKLQITSENDPLWYSYENQKWANVAMIDGLEIEGGIKVTEENKNDLVGETVTKTGNMSVWIPKFASKDSEVTFIYSTSNSYVDENGNLKDIDTKDGFEVNNAFDENSEGVWATKYDSNSVATIALNNNTSNDTTKAAEILANSIYGNKSNLTK